MNIAVIMACHNRVELTKRAIRSLEKHKPINWVLQYFVCDDGSTDGTTNFLRSLPIEIKVLTGDGKFFWAKSMMKAMLDAHSLPDIDAYLLFNDDVELNDTNTLNEFNILSEKYPECIVVGQLLDNLTKEISYGGLIRTSRHPFRTKLVHALSQPEFVDTFHGNFVLIPSSIVKKIGLLDGDYSHGYADFDYGYRAREMQVRMLVCPGFVGTCNLNKSINIDTIGFLVKNLFSRKGRPIRSQIKFSRRFGGVEWPIYVIGGYVMPIFRLLTHRNAPRNDGRGNHDETSLNPKNRG
jgi:GT2 family glycosyltransferase